MTKGEIDKIGEDVVCTLKDGFKLRFWDTTLSDAEYIRRTKEVQRLEKLKHD